MSMLNVLILLTEAASDNHIEDRGSNLVVLNFNRIDNIDSGQVVLHQFIGIEPDTHGVLGTEELGFPHRTSF